MFLRNTPIKLFLTCWIVYALHFATDIVREIYPAIAIGDSLSYDLGEYANLHLDIFEKPGFGWHIGNNPGVSMLAAIPYTMARPLIDPIAAADRRIHLSESGIHQPKYDSPWRLNRDFFAKAWRRGLLLKLGLAAFTMQSLCMAPFSAAAVVLLYLLLCRVLPSKRTALWLAILYAFGTPVFFRTGYLNHNLMLGHIGFCGFILLWNPSAFVPWSARTRFALAGVAAGTTILFDYSGAVMCFALFTYGLTTLPDREPLQRLVRHPLAFLLGMLPPLLLLWHYQWHSFGHPFYPGQHWMPPVQWSDLGYRGFGLPQWELFSQLGFDRRFGLFPSSPVLCLALLSPFFALMRRSFLRWRELLFCLFLVLAWWIFFASSNYTRLQFNTGIRYMSSILPFVFLATAVVIVRLSPRMVFVIFVVSIAQSWAMAMYRDVEHELGVIQPILNTFLGGFNLPALETLARVDTYGRFFEFGPSPWPLYAVAAVTIYGIWVNPFGQRQPPK